METESGKPVGKLWLILVKNNGSSVTKIGEEAVRNQFPA